MPATIAEFHPYQKIAESTQEWLADERVVRSLSRLEWIVTEKIHGANFCFVVTEDAIACAKRKTILGTDDEFFNYRTVLDRLGPTAGDVAKELRGSHPEAASIAIYGELFGGGYPHPEVAPVPEVAPIQTGVYYAPGVEFCAFDIAIDFAATVERERLWLDVDVLIEVCNRAGLFAVRCVEPSRRL